MKIIQRIPTKPTELLRYLEYAEVAGRRAPDARRVLRQERFALQSAVRSGNAAKIAAARDEAVRVATMWEGF